jgi:hypothetical protein
MVVYPQIGDRDIRVVELLPGSGHETIRCSFHVASLDSHPVYEALSYVWGDPDITRLIIVNGIETQVTANLECALQHIRNPTEAK